LVAVGLVLVLSGLDSETRAADAPINAFVHISDDEGLAHSDVRAIAQDLEGFMWFGLRLGGLTRYDGYELKTYQHDPQNPKTIGSKIIWSVIVDRKGNVWVGTEGGLDRYDRASDSFVHYQHDPQRPDSLPHNIVTCLMEDSSGKIWAGTRRGLARLDDPASGKFSNFFRPPPIPGSSAPNTVRSIIEDHRTGLLWLGTSDGVAAFDPRTGKFASFIETPGDPHSLTRNAVNKVIKSPTGEFWAFTEFGFNSFRCDLTEVREHTVQQPRIAFKRFIQPSDPATPGSNYVRDGLFDQKGRLWMASRGGVLLLDPKTEKITQYRRDPSDPASLSDDLTQAIFEDRSGNLWVATFAGGVTRLRSETKPFRVHRHRPGDPNSLSDNRVVGLAMDSIGRLWAATVNGLNVYDGRTWKRFVNIPGDPTSIPSNDLSTVATTPTGEVWVGSNYNGAYRYDQSRFHSFGTTSSNAPVPHGWHTFTGEQVNSFLADNTGGVWIGARAYGLDYYKDGKFLHFAPRETSDGQPPQPTINPILGVFGPDDTLWFGTERHGLVQLNLRTHQFTTHTLPGEGTGLRRSALSIAQTPDTIWLGLADGLVRFDLRTKTFTGEFNTKDGLPHDSITTIVPDSRGHLWLATANGLVDLDPETRRIRVYEKADGLPTSVFAQRAGTRGPDGRIYLGTRAGIVEFDPTQLRDNPLPPPVVITELRWLGVPPKGAPVDGVVINVGESLRVPPGQLGFTLKFSALDFSAPEKNRFRYRLEGLDENWTSVGARERSATYTALPPGNYTFRVQASNADGVWNEQGATVLVVVEPYVWQTIWFKLALAAAGTGLVVAGVQLRLRSIRKRNALLERQVSQRTAQLQAEVAVRQKAEAALRQSHAELEHRVRERTAELAEANLNLQAEIAERKSVEAQLRQSQKMEAIGQLAGGVAHDFNNLLTVILGQIQLLGDPNATQEERESAIRDINAAAQRATNLTRQLLVFSRHQAVSPAAVNLNDVVGGVSKLLGHLIGEHITLNTRLADEPLGVRADAGMLEQVILNMAVNARDAMPRGGTLTISTERLDLSAGDPARHPNAKPGSYARFSVSDTGHGIPARVLPQIFEPFFTTKESGKGTGLGLAISLGIVQQHGGWIDVETEEGRGTTFRVHLPLHQTKESPATKRAEREPAGLEPKTILLAEDESAVRNVVKQLLVRNGHRVLESSSASEALVHWAKHSEEIDLLITDIVMPGELNGHELAERLTRDRKTLRVLTMSGHDPTEVASSDSSSTARPLLRKPFTADELLRAVRDVMNG
jgi:signal transduction histidine kinase/ligand-binding sensor domain-containing protein